MAVFKVSSTTPMSAVEDFNPNCMGTGNWKDMGNIYVNNCTETPSQNWFVMADGRIALEPSGQSKSLHQQVILPTAYVD